MSLLDFFSAVLRPDQLDPDLACVLLIDVQEKLLPLIRGNAHIVAACEKLLDGAAIFEIPVLATEQYPRGLGPSQASLKTRLERVGARVLEKPTFSACGEPSVRAALDALDRSQIILAGIEAHVCVQQTALDLAVLDYDTFVCADAIGSRGRMDFEQALGRMRQGGVKVTSVESVLFELCGRCDSARFKRMIEIIKSSPPQDD